MQKIKIGALVKIGKGTKVYRVSYYYRNNDTYYLSPDADHPDAAKRLADAFRVFSESDLVVVRK